MAQATLPSTPLLQEQDFRKLKTLFSGLVAGVVSRTAVAPFERIVIIKQTSMSEYSGRQGVFSMLASIYRAEGPKGFFRGNAANCYRIAPTTAIEFLLYDLFKSKLAPFGFLSEKARYTLSGSFAGVCAYAAAYPIDVVKTFQSLGLYKNQAVFPTLLQLAREKGVLQLYRGLLATCCVRSADPGRLPVRRPEARLLPGAHEPLLRRRTHEALEQRGKLPARRPVGLLRGDHHLPHRLRQTQLPGLGKAALTRSSEASKSSTWTSCEPRTARVDSEASTRASRRRTGRSSRPQASPSSSTTWRRTCCYTS